MEDTPRLEVGGRSRSNLLAPWVLILGPMLPFIRMNGRSLLAPEVLVIIGITVIGGLCFGVVLRRTRHLRFGTLFYVASLSALILIWADLQFGIDGRFKLLGAITLPLTWILREHVATIVVAVAATLSVSTLLTVRPNVVDTWQNASGDAVPASSAGRDLPTIVHLVVDEHLGFVGAPVSPRAAATRSTVERAYVEGGFLLYTGAYSRYSHTAHALPHMMNFVASNDLHPLLVGPDGTGALSRNDYFQRLMERGYGAHVYQTAHLGFCLAPAGFVDTCVTTPANSLLAIDKLQYGLLQRAAFVVTYYLSNESYLFEQKVVGIMRRVRGRLGMAPAPGPVKSAGPASALDLLERAELAITRAPSNKGRFYFVHLLLPHRPSFLNAACQMRTDPVPFTALLPALESEGYLDQVECVTALVHDFLERIRPAVGDDAVVVIHSDHGARLEWPYDDRPAGIDEGRFADGYATLFAVRAAGITAGTDPAPVSLDEVLEFLSRVDFKASAVPSGEPFVFDDRRTAGRPWPRNEVLSEWFGTDVGPASPTGRE